MSFMGKNCVLVALMLVGATFAHGQTVTYSLQDQVPLLVDSFYESGDGKLTFNSLANADGSKVYVWAYDYGTGLADLYVVDVGSPSSAQLLWPSTSNRAFLPIDFSPDFSNILIPDSGDTVLVDAVTGEVNPIGEPWLPVTQPPFVPQAVEPNYEFIVNFVGGDLETQDFNGITGPDVKDVRCFEQLLDTDPSVQAAYANNLAQAILDGGGVVGESAAFYMTVGRTEDIAVAQAFIEDPAVGGTFSGAGAYDATAAATVQAQLAICVPAGEGDTPNGPLVNMYYVEWGKYTSKPSSNHYVQEYVETAGSYELVAIPVNTDGSADNGRNPVVLTDINVDRVALGTVSADGDLVSFVYQRNMGSGVPTEGDLYLLSGVNAIIAAPLVPGTDISSTAPTSLADPRITAVHLSSQAPGIWHGTPGLSNDGSLLFYNSETTSNFITEDFPFNLPISDWDINVATTDGSAPNFRIVEPGNQGVLRPFPSGARFSYVIDGPGQPGPFDMRIILTNVATTSELEPTQSDPVPETETTVEISGETVDLPFVLTDSAVQTTEDIMIEDASGTTVELPAEQVINFPDGTTEQSITISTPIEPVEDAQLPPSVMGSAMPVIREFGPTGTEFFPAIEISITYTDNEIAGLDEATMTPFLFNEATGIFDVEVPESDIVSRDLVNNVIVFRVDHFSMYGLAFLDPSQLPAGRPLGMLAIFAFLAVSGAVMLTVRAGRTVHRERN